ncbi:hypothetical protein V7S43_017069 [Phytophthora oleae]|uniref:Mediator complex subunit 15 KIX domain-containing protein n=1 Tax=Phytophthora oleae TaxID=2107226 RepID=A0ABD3EWE8_9STRA
MDPHGVNAMGMQGGMSMPMSMAMPGANGANPQAMAMGMNGGMVMNAYGVPQQQQQQMMMNMGQMNQMNMGSMAMKMNPNAMNPAAATATGPGMQAQQGAAGADWRIQLTREHRANLIAKIYNEMVRVSADPVPGIKLWMNVSWYELTLYKESRTQEEYINKIFTRLKSLRAQQTDMNAVMAAQTLPNQGMLSRLDFSYYNTLNLNQRPGANGGQVAGYPGHPQFGGPGAHPGAQQPQPGKPMATSAGGMPTNPAVPNGANTTPRTAAKPDGGAPVAPGDMTAEYWRQHAALKAKYHDDVEKVHGAFKKYVDHMKGHDETEQKKKLRYLLSYVQLCASILNEDKTTHAPRKIEELDKVYKYIVKIVNPYLKKLRTETDKRSFTPNAASSNPTGMNSSASTNPSASAGAPTSVGGAPASVNTSSGPNGAMLMQQGQQNMSLQQKQQQYLMQQRAQQMQQQQQRMQAQARQQQMMQHQQMMQQQQQKGLTPPNQGQHSVQQTNQANAPMQQQNGQPAGAHQTPQQSQQQQQLAQQSQQAQQAQQQPQQPQQPRQPQQSQQQNQQPQQQTKNLQQGQQQQQSQAQSQQQKPQQQQAQQSAPTSRTDTSSLSLDESLYGGMDSSGLLQMPSNLGSSGSSSGFMNFPNDLSPTNFSSMDLLDMDGFMGGDNNSSSGPGSGGHNNSNSNGGNNTNSGDGGDSDLMFMEAL